jgi:hypothetical protein
MPLENEEIGTPLRNRLSSRISEEARHHFESVFRDETSNNPPAALKPCSQCIQHLANGGWIVLGQKNRDEPSQLLYLVKGITGLRVGRSGGGNGRWRSFPLAAPASRVR